MMSDHIGMGHAAATQQAGTRENVDGFFCVPLLQGPTALPQQLRQQVMGLAIMRYCISDSISTSLIDTEALP